MSLEAMKKKVELERVKLGKLEIELKIEERKQDIARLQESLEVSKQRIAELETWTEGSS